MNRIRDMVSVFEMPRCRILLRHRDVADVDPYYAALTRECYRDAKRRSWKRFGFGIWDFGYAVCRLPKTFDEYFMLIEAAGRRNVKKARRLGYRFAPIAYNDYLPEIREIRRSTDSRQGMLSDSFLNEDLQLSPDPAPVTSGHGYPYFGIFLNDQLVAFCGGLLSGEVFAMEQIYGHAAHMKNGVVPFLIVGSTEYLYQQHSGVQFFSYGTCFGADESMRRFKRKFQFCPHIVKWIL